jgi:(S)-2-hydroxyglutarate dehydrogenase
LNPSKTLSADLVIVGAGVLGTSLAYWASTLFGCRVLLVDKAAAPGMHSSTRNTGVVHTPFYLDPTRKRVFARSALLSKGLWQSLAVENGLPWRPAGTLDVAVREDQVPTLYRYQDWARRNGVPESEVEVVDSRRVKALEPEVEARAALHVKGDVSADFGAFTRALLTAAERSGTHFLGGASLEQVEGSPERTTFSLRTSEGRLSVSARVMVNAAGGGSLRIAHSLGLGSRFSALSFRGEYWVVDGPLASRVSMNIYTPPGHPEFPFLDPHFVVRASGERQVGPNAVLVPGPYVYSGLGLRSIPRLADRPLAPKLRLLADPRFLRLLQTEWWSSASKRALCGRVARFVRALSPGMLKRRAVFGIRTSLLDRDGFVPEAVTLFGRGSVHVLNYNSPGATGAPAYSALLVHKMKEQGLFDGFRPRLDKGLLRSWDFEDVVSGF